VIEVLNCGPLALVQDRGRPGYLAQGLSRGGAADRWALDEAEALVGRATAIEMPGSPLTLRIDVPGRVALTGAPMRAELSGRALRWHAAHPVEAGEVLSLRPTGIGVYAYVTPCPGLATEVVMGSRSVHGVAGIGRPLARGDVLPTGEGGAGDVSGDGPRILSPEPDRFGGGTLRLAPTPQTRLFSEADRARFEAATFIRSPRGNRQGVRLEGPTFAMDGQLNLMSDFVLPGDVQMTGDGVPYILGPDCQTTGGYPRIGTVIAADLSRALQAPPGASLRFRFVTPQEARAARPGPPRTAPLRRDARAANLLENQLIGGVVSARGDA
jgi:allophanate hydrolase